MIPKRILEREDVGAAAKLVWAAIVDRIRENTSAWPSLPRIAKDTGLSAPTAKRATKELVNSGLLRKTSRGNGRSNQYQIDPGFMNLVHSDPGQIDPPTRVKLIPDRGQIDPQKKTKEEDTEKKTNQPASAGGGSAHSRVCFFFCSEWERKNGAKYPFVRGKDGMAVKRLLDAVGGDEMKAKRVVEAYLGDPDPWLAEKAWALGILATRLPALLAGKAKTTAKSGLANDSDFERVANASE